MIFFDHDRKRNAETPVDADHVGIVVELIEAQGEEPAKIRTIEGNASDKVKYRTYELDDPTIGKVFARCPEGGGIAYAVQNRLKKAAAFQIVDAEVEV